jgi:hypothetical protein
MSAPINKAIVDGKLVDVGDVTDEHFLLVDHACTVISEAGCFADKAITDKAEFNRVDRSNRVAAAAKDLETLLQQIINWQDVKVAAPLIAAMMLRQHDHDEREHRAPPDTVTISRQKWQELREIAARQIDPATAEVDYEMANLSDPYGVNPQSEGYCVGRIYFARNPGSNVWVHFHDLPDATRKALEARVTVTPEMAEAIAGLVKEGMIKKVRGRYVLTDAAVSQLTDAELLIWHQAAWGGADAGAA